MYSNVAESVYSSSFEKSLGNSTTAITAYWQEMNFKSFQKEGHEMIHNTLCNTLHI